ncbi:MAG: hypothetical protein ACMXYL_03010 [Candidatus Woesearchaeota archaeon]
MRIVSGLLLVMAVLLLFVNTADASLGPKTYYDDNQVPFSFNISCNDHAHVNYLIIKTPDNRMMHFYKHFDHMNFTVTLYEPGNYKATCVYLYSPTRFGRIITMSQETVINALMPLRPVDVPLEGTGTLQLIIRDENGVPFGYEDNVRFSIENTFHQNLRYNPIGGYQELGLGSRAQHRIIINQEGYPVTTRDFVIDSTTLTANVDVRLYRTTTPQGGTLRVNVFSSEGRIPLPTARVSLRYGDDWIARDIAPGTIIPNLIIQRTYTIIVESDNMSQRITQAPITGKENTVNIYLFPEGFLS